MALPDATQIAGGLLDLVTNEHPDEEQMLRVKRGSKSTSGPDVTPEELAEDAAVVWDDALQDEVVERLTNGLRFVPDGSKHRRALRTGHRIGGVQRKLTNYSEGDLAECIVEKLEQSKKEIADRDAAIATAIRGLRRGAKKPLLVGPLLQSINLGAPYPPGFMPNVEPPPKPFQKWTIVDVQGELPELATQVESAIITSAVSPFVRGNDLVRPTTAEVEASDGRRTLTACFRPIGQPAMTDIAAQCCTFVQMRKPSGRPKKTAEGEEATPAKLVPTIVDPRPAIIGTVLSRVGKWRFPPVVGVVTTPTLRPDGSVLMTPGYDPSTRLVLMPDPSIDLSRMPARPTWDDAVRALELIGGLLLGFRFVGSADRSVALSGILTAVCRGALGPCPIHAWTAPVPASGKSLQVDLVSAFTSGRPCPVFTAGSSIEEMEKRVGAAMLSGIPLISIDNMTIAVAGDLLCAATTQEVFGVRILGKSVMPEIESRGFTLFCNGNNLMVQGDMTRRALLGQLDTGAERPETLQYGFDPVQRVLSNRSAYIAAALTVVRAYVNAGCPGRLAPIGSFGRWSDLIRSALVWLGCDDPVAGMQTARETDTVTGVLGVVLKAWHDLYAGEAVTCRDVVMTVSGFGHVSVPENAAERAARALKIDALRDAIAPVATNGKGLDALKLGHWLRGSRGRPIGRLKFDSDGTVHGGAAAWKVVAA